MNPEFMKRVDPFLRHPASPMRVSTGDVRIPRPHRLHDVVADCYDYNNHALPA